MRNRPEIKNLPQFKGGVDLSTPRPPVPPSTPQSQGDTIVPFLHAGGQPFFLDIGDSNFNPAIAGVQLLATQFVPRGFTAWIKRLAVAPYMPPSLFDPWAGWAANFEVFEALPLLGLPAVRGAARAGLWRTPFGWESYIDGSTEVRPSWRWALTMWSGDLALYRQQQFIPPFDPTDPTSWPFAPDVAVPASAYPQGLPGRAVPGYVQHQRAQILPEDAFATHIQIPENNTIMLWAYWQQSTLALRSYAPGGVQLVFPNLSVMPLGASFGSIHGYMQATDRDAATENARYGWGG